MIEKKIKKNIVKRTELDEILLKFTEADNL